MSNAPEAHALLEEIFRDALAAVDAEATVARAVTRTPEGVFVAGRRLAGPRVFVLAVGKAAVPMAKAAAEKYGGDFDGILLAPTGYLEQVRGFASLEGSHPLPSTANVRATTKIAEKVLELEEEDMFLALISGGTSALLCLPAKGVSLQRKIMLTEELLAHPAAGSRGRADDARVITGNV